VIGREITLRATDTVESVSKRLLTRVQRNRGQ